MDGAKRNQIIATLYDCYKANGFITENEALSLFSQHRIPLHQIDSITAHLLTLGVIIQDDDEVEELYVDRSKIDYDKFFDEVIEAEPELKPFIEYVRGITPPQPREWRKLLPQAQNGNEYAKNRLIEMYLRLVVRTAWYYSNKYHFSFEDALQDGLIGAITAIEKFNPADHANYATYYPLWVTQIINRNAWLPNNPTYFPVHIKEKLFSIIDEVEQHYCEHCPNADNQVCQQLAKGISLKREWTIEETERYIFYLMCWSSLDEMIDNDDEPCDGGVFYDDLLDEVDTDLSMILLMELINELKPREKDVILMRFGFTDKGNMTLGEVGGVLDVTRERVRQIETKAFRRIGKRIALNS